MRSVTESPDPSPSPSPFYVRATVTPFAQQHKQDAFDFRQSAPSSPQGQFKPNKLSISINPMMKSDISAIYNGRLFTSSGKDFYSGFDVPKEEEDKGKNKFDTLGKKREEVLCLHTWNSEQASSLKKLTFYFQEMRSKITEVTPLSEMLTQIENKTYDILMSVGHTIESAWKENMLTSKKLRDSHGTGRHLSVNQKASSKERSEKIEKSPKKDNHLSIKKAEIMGNTQDLLIQKLQNENEFLLKQLEEFLNHQDVDKLIKELEKTKANTRQKTEHYEAELRNRENMLSKVEIMYNGTKRMNENLNQANKTMETRLTELQEEYNTMKKSFETLSEEKNMYRERSFMQLADYESLREQYNTLQEYFEKLKDRYLEEREKTKKLSDMCVIYEKSEAASTYNIEVQTLGSLQEAPTTGKTINLKRLNDTKTAAGVDLNNYALAKPAYSLLFPKQDKNAPVKEARITMNFVGMLRAIYDSKYNEFLYAENYAQVSRFPEFVYSWIGKFVLDNNTRKVRASKITDIDPDIVRTDMLALFQTPVSSRLWECIVFKEFLEEKHTRDELLYFLHCRHLLFRGPQLNDQSSTFIFNYYVRLEWAEYVLEQLLGHKHSWESLNVMKAKFRDRAKQKKRNVHLIDSIFFLRILLEEYKKEKAEKILTYKRALMENHGTMSPSHGKKSISFDAVREFFTSHFPETYEIEKVEFYRKCWMYNNGTVDADSLLMVMNEENFFSKLINFGGLDEKLAPKGLGIHLNSQTDKVYDTVLRQYRALNGNLNLLQDSIVQMGVEKFLVDNQEFDKRIRTSSYETKGFHGKDIHIELMNFFTHTYKLGNMLLYLNGPERGLTAEGNVEEVFATFKGTFDRMNEDKDGQRKEFELNIKAKKLQKFLKGKLSSWYKLMKFILRHKLHKFSNNNDKAKKKTQ